tara:strand:- start:605 stop:1291 length:687 start_codon:yes stop_codon:yes gene_type:complete
VHDQELIKELYKSGQYKAQMIKRWDAAMQHPSYFLGQFCWTIDVHDESNPIKNFPLRPHIKTMTQLWVDNPLLVIVKSRQMMMTWLFCALALWDVLAHKGKLIMLQSKTEREAVGDQYSGQGLLGRAKFILSQLPTWLVPPHYSKGTQLIFPTQNSTLWAVPQGAAIIRSYTSAGILSDESAYQDEFEQSYAAATPTIRGGGWFVALSTAAPSFFQSLYEDTVGKRVA